MQRTCEKRIGRYRRAGGSSGQNQTRRQSNHCETVCNAHSIGFTHLQNASPCVEQIETRQNPFARVKLSIKLHYEHQIWTWKKAAVTNVSANFAHPLEAGFGACPLGVLIERSQR